MNENIRLKLSLLPDSPGCYLMKQDDRIIYVGKAVRLKSRVSSYFRKTAHTPKVAAMISHIDDFDIILCNTNLEALLLESNLIKLHQPYYNILLKDDKRYPYIRIDLNEPYPRLSIARKPADDGAKYFGPYIGATVIRQVMDILRRVFPLRTCSLSLPLKKPIRPCINYDIGQCLGPCANKCTFEEYREVVDNVVEFLKGKYQPVIAKLEEGMVKAAKELQYERAAELRNCIFDIRGLMEQQNVESANQTHQDIIALAQDGLDALVQVLYIRGGKLLGADAFPLPREGMESAQEVLDAFLLQFYQDRIPAREVIVETLSAPEDMSLWLRARRDGAVDLSIPQRGDKRALILTAKKNAADALQKRNAHARIKEERTTGAVKELAQALDLDFVPHRIEGFDISNTQGTLSVASMVVFIDGEPVKKEYRHFRIKTVEGANDFASMNEVLSRRFLRTQREEEKERWPLPDLVLVDGGPEQLRFAREAMLATGIEVPMFGLAKRLEEIYLPNKTQPIRLDMRSPALHLIQRIRDESHRFAITHHRNLRAKAGVRSRLEDIPGIGPARRRALLAHFRTMKAVSDASLEELQQVRSMSKSAAQQLYLCLHPQESKAAEDLNANA
ncbi:MAG: excinuclease ABC subunit UvrC [Clostridiales bacterium]|nr:excinuclease ABC subunit UvrC [Clostridiales bacterium]